MTFVASGTRGTDVGGKAGLDFGLGAGPDICYEVTGVGVARGLSMGMLVLAAVYPVLVSGALPGVVGVLLLAVAAGVVPSAPTLTRRIALNGTMLIGWTPMAWWFHLPFGLNHGAFLTTLVLAGLTAHVSSHPYPRLCARSLVPAVRGVDLIVLASGFAALATCSQLATAGTARRALTVLLPGYDNSAHFSMYLMLRRHGTTIDLVSAPPDGTGWTYAHYPQGFHALLATYADIVRPHAGSGASELPVYAQAVAALVVLGTVVLVASVCSLPRLRERPLVALPVATLVCTAFLWGPGAAALADGFGNFWFGALGAANALVLSISGGRRLPTLETAAVGGMILLVTHAWAPLGMFAAPAAFAMLLPAATRRRRYAGWLRTVAISLVCVATAAGVLKAVSMLVKTVDVENIVVAHGQVHGAWPLPAFVLIVACGYVCLAGLPLVRQRAGLLAQDAFRRARTLILVPALAVMCGGALLAAQLHTLGTSSYYFVKFFVGTELIIATLTAAVGGMILSIVLPPARGFGTGIALSVVVGAAATQSLGHVRWHDAPMTSSLHDGHDVAGGRLSWDAMAGGILASAGDVSAPVDFSQEYVALGEDRGFEAVLPAAWYHALTATATTKSSARGAQLATLVTDADDAAPVVRPLLESDRALRVVVAPQFVSALQEEMGSADLAQRIVRWPGVASSVEAEGER